MSYPNDAQLAALVAGFLTRHHCVVTTLPKFGAVEIHYTLRDDVKPQPPITIKDGRVSIPKGSQEAVVMALLLGI